MKLYEAQNIIKDVFEQKFDKGKYAYFVRNLLKNLQTSEFTRTGYNIPKAFTGFISLYERIGKYEDEEGNQIDVLVVKLNKAHSIDYARSKQRSFVRWYLNKKMREAALVAFYCEKSSDWRFSFIKMQYSLKKKKDELTPAKRFSFMVGEKGKSHTAQRQLINILKNDYSPTLSDIEEAFSIEAVSDEFYKRYHDLLFNLVDAIDKIIKRDQIVKIEFENQEIEVLDFSKKLLGQIVFLYFLQRKGWLGLDEGDKYGDGDKNFLRNLFNQVKPKENFFNDYLEFLFYDALSRKRVTDYYKKFNTRIPFLNGGLFDPINFYNWEKTDIRIPNKLFSYIKDDEEGSGILDVFDLYNFTVKEDKALNDVKICDPAVGSGAFPVGVMNELVKLRILLTPFIEKKTNRDSYHFKANAIQNSIYGVDIDAGAVEIAKLRLWQHFILMCWKKELG